MPDAVISGGTSDGIPEPGGRTNVVLGCGKGGTVSTGGIGRLGNDGDDGRAPVPDAVPGMPGPSEAVAFGKGATVKGRLDA